MDTIEFILVLLVLAIVLRWYVLNESNHAGGGAGLLAIRDAAPARPARRYRLKTRIAPLRGRTPDRAQQGGAAAYRQREHSGAPRYRARDNARYAVSERAARLPRPKCAPAHDKADRSE